MIVGRKAEVRPLLNTIKGVTKQCENRYKMIRRYNKSVIQGFRVLKRTSDPEKKYRIGKNSYDYKGLRSAYKVCMTQLKRYSKSSAYAKIVRDFNREMNTSDAKKDRKVLAQYLVKRYQKEAEKMNKNSKVVYQDAIAIVNLLTKTVKKNLVKESANMTPEERKEYLYAECAAGNITVDEREDLLRGELDEDFYETMEEELLPELEEAAFDEVEYESGIPIEESMRVFTPTEKFQKMRALLYERCSEGIISVEERENLLEAARERAYGNVEE